MECYIICKDYLIPGTKYLLIILALQNHFDTFKLSYKNDMNMNILYIDNLALATFAQYSIVHKGTQRLYSVI